MPCHYAPQPAHDEMEFERTAAVNLREFVEVTKTLSDMD